MSKKHKAKNNSQSNQMTGHASGQATTYYISGMHCASCRTIVRDTLENIDGVSIVSFASTGNQITLRHTVPLSEINHTLSEFDYSLSATAARKNFWLTFAGVIVATYIAYMLLKRFDMPLLGFTTGGQISLGGAAFLGLIASLSTCFAVSGGLLLGITKNLQSQWDTMRFGLLFNGGRLLSYAILGGVLGLVGSFLKISSTVETIILFLVSVLLLMLGLQMTGVISFGYADRVIDKLTAHSNKGAIAALLVGGATFFLPCGFTQALQLYALQQGSFWTGFSVLGAFAIGTLPGLLLVNFLPTLLSARVRRAILWIAGIFLVLMGIFGLMAVWPALTSTGSAVVTSGTDSALSQGLISAGVVGSANTTGTDVQIVKMSVVGYTYQPDSIDVNLNKPVQWVIDASRAAGCARVLVVPSLGIKKVLDTTKPTVITFTPTKTGTISFTCSMGMTGPGKFVVK